MKSPSEAEALDVDEEPPGTPGLIVIEVVDEEEEELVLLLPRDPENEAWD